MARYLYSELASAIDAYKRCKRTDGDFVSSEHPARQPMSLKWEDTIDMLVSHLPSGSGFDCGTEVDIDRSHAGKLVLTTSYHHMHESGMYDGWTEHEVIVTPSFHGFNLRITGRDRNGIKDYMYETFHAALSEDVEYFRLIASLPLLKQMARRVTRI